MTRTSDTESLILSAPTAADGAAATGTPLRTAQHQRAVAGISTPTGRPKSPTSTRSLQALGRELTEIAEAASITPADALVTLRLALNTREQLAALGDDP